jgi:hypothetical protein
MGLLRDLFQWDVKGKRGGAYLFNDCVGHFIREETLRELVREVRKGKFGELRKGRSGEARYLDGEVESSIGSEPSKNRL